MILIISIHLDMLRDRDRMVFDGKMEEMMTLESAIDLVGRLCAPMTTLPAKREVMVRRVEDM